MLRFFKKAEEVNRETNYSLKVSTPHDAAEIHGAMQIIYADFDINMKHDMNIGLNHFNIITMKDDLNINILCVGEATGKKVYDIYHLVTNKHKNTKVNIIFKAVSRDSSKIVYRSDIVCMKGASGSGAQTAKFILDSAESEIDVIPSLDINSKEMPTTHAASIGGVDKDLIWYSALHGLDKISAKDMIIDGFLNK